MKSTTKHQQPYTKFIILSMPRTGSNYLSYFLNDHPGIVSAGEIFDEKTIWGQPGKTAINHNRILKYYRNHFPTHFLDTVMFHTYTSSIQAVGFRFFYSQVTKFPNILPHLQAPIPCRIIHLKRKNLLQNLISFKLAVHTQVWSSLSGTQPPVKIRIEYKECLHHFQKTTAMWNYYDKFSVDFPFLSVYYEDLTENPQRILRRIQKFLSVDKRILTCPLTKQNNRDVKSVVINYSELRKKFLGSQWEIFFP